MFRYFSNPFNAAVFKGHIGVDAFGNGVVDFRLAQLLQALYLLLFDANQPVYLLTFLIQKFSNGGLLGEWGESDYSIVDILLLNINSCKTSTTCSEVFTISIAA